MNKQIIKSGISKDGLKKVEVEHNSKRNTYKVIHYHRGSRDMEFQQTPNMTKVYDELTNAQDEMERQLNERVEFISSLR